MIEGCKIHGIFLTNETIGGKAKCPKCAIENPDPPWFGHIYIGGLDTAKYRDYSAMTDIDINVREKHVQINGWKIWPHVDYSVIEVDAARRYKQVHMKILGVDRGGAGDSIIEQLNHRGVRTEPLNFTNTTKTDMVNHFRSLRQGSDPILLLPPKGAMSELDSQLAEQELIIDEGPTTKFRHPSGRNDDLLWSLLMACYVGRQYITGGSGWVRPMKEVGVT